VAAAGIYLVSAVLRMSCTASTEPLTVDAYITAGTDPDVWRSNQLTLAGLRETDGNPVFAAATGLIKITNAATEKIAVISGVSNVVVNDELEESARFLCIQRVA
jgi:hypothetical protein